MNITMESSPQGKSATQLLLSLSRLYKVNLESDVHQMSQRWNSRDFSEFYYEKTTFFFFLAYLTYFFVGNYNTCENYFTNSKVL